MARPTLEENRPTQLNRVKREQRVPINGNRSVLDVSGKEDGFHYCWVNDYNVDKFIDAYYEYVEHAVTVGHTKIDAASAQGAKVSKKVGNGLIAFLMRIPVEYYTEDVKAMNQKVDELEGSMRENLNNNKDGLTGKVEIARGRVV